jgi:hypothetical protein
MADPIQTTSAAQFGINDMMSMPRQCGYCGMIHGPRCPSVQAIEYYPDGSVKRVEFVKYEAVQITRIPNDPWVR